MKNVIRSLSTSIYLVFLISPCLFTPGFAQSQNIPANYKIENGITSLERGDAESAINDFKKALLLDPSNDEAKAQLRKLGFQEEDFIKTSLSQTSALIQHMYEHQSHIALLERQKSDLEKKFSEIQSQNNTLSKINQAKDLERDVIQEKVQLLTQIMTDKERVKFDQELAQFKAMAAERADRPDQKLSFAEKEVKLKAIKEKFAGMTKDSEKYEKQLVALGERYGRLNQDTFGRNAKEDDITQVLEDYAFFKKQMYELKGAGVAQAERFSKHESRMLEKMEELLALHESIGKYIKFLEVRENFIRKNNSLMTSLRTDMSSAQFDSNIPGAMTKASQIDLISLEEDLQHLKADIHQARLPAGQAGMAN